MSTAPVKSLIDEQLEEIEFAGRTRAAALRLAERHGYNGHPARNEWVAPGIWLFRYTSIDCRRTLDAGPGTLEKNVNQSSSSASFKNLPASSLKNSVSSGS